MNLDDAPGLARVRKCIEHFEPGLLPAFDALQAENARLRESLDEYGGHAEMCHSREQTMRLPCNCGWPETRAALAGGS